MRAEPAWSCRRRSARSRRRLQRPARNRRSAGRRNRSVPSPRRAPGGAIFAPVAAQAAARLAGTGGTAAEAVERCPGRAGNCSVQGSVGNGQPGHPVVDSFAGRRGGRHGGSGNGDRLFLTGFARLDPSGRPSPSFCLLAGAHDLVELPLEVRGKAAPNPFAIGSHSHPFIGFGEIGRKAVASRCPDQGETILGLDIALRRSHLIPIFGSFVILLQVSGAELIKAAEAELRSPRHRDRRPAATRSLREGSRLFHRRRGRPQHRLAPTGGAAMRRPADDRAGNHDARQSRRPPAKKIDFATSLPYVCRISTLVWR